MTPEPGRRHYSSRRVRRAAPARARPGRRGRAGHRRRDPAATWRRPATASTSSTTATQALDAVRRLKPAAIILDVGLPGLDGIEVCRRLRAEHDWTPVLFVTARDDEVDRIVGLEIGADDYVTKPFSPRELVARVTGVLRRTHGAPEAPPQTVGAVTLDAAQRRVFIGADELGADGDRVRPARPPDAPARPGLHPRAAAQRGVGLLGRRRHPHRGRAHRPAARQARRGQPDPHRARRRLRRREPPGDDVATNQPGDPHLAAQRRHRGDHRGDRRRARHRADPQRTAARHAHMPTSPGSPTSRSRRGRPDRARRPAATAAGVAGAQRAQRHRPAATGRWRPAARSCAAP